MTPGISFLLYTFGILKTLQISVRRKNMGFKKAKVLLGGMVLGLCLLTG